MLFNSFVFLVFFFVVFIIYWLLNERLTFQNILLLISSYIFYSWWDWRFLSLIILSSFIDYFVGLKVHSVNDDKIKIRWLGVSLVANLGMLGVFKYYNFFVDSFSLMVGQLGWQPNDLTLQIILPVGISFYTFQTLSYTLDIYRGTLKPTKNILSFFTYIAFFPQLVAGPIERAANLLPQIETKRKFSKVWFKEGTIQIFIGLFRKIVIADNLGKYVDVIFDNPDLHNSSSLLVALIFYAFQIYFDFSGYSDIAIGTAKLLGFQFRPNFNLPYFSTSLTEFWRRWHMSLSFWLRDYLYISLGGNRKGIYITYRNLMLTMLIGGLWHGSSWNFVIWGGIHGVVLSVEKFLNSKKILLSLRKNSVLGFLITFSIVNLAWVFFRASDLSTAITYVKGLLSFNFNTMYIGNISVFVNCLFVLFLGILFDFILAAKEVSLEHIGNYFKTPRLVTIISFLIIIICLFYSTSENFIYFQF